jgi:Na+-translocating ferredoxin:NAD+ oxidoreductase RnfG subunit
MKYILFPSSLASILVMTFMTFFFSPVQAQDYNLMSVEQAQQMIFPSATRFIQTPITLTEAQKEAIAETTDLKVRFLEIPVWQAMDADGKRLGIVTIDKVIGKHEFIIYALGITPEGKATAPFILDFRESYGQQIERQEWRNQFVGKTRHDRLKVGKDIDNISGATLSCVNVTNGIRRMLQTYEMAISKVLP